MGLGEVRFPELSTLCPALYCNRIFVRSQTTLPSRLSPTNLEMSLDRSFKLNSGYTIPAVGLGTWVSLAFTCLLEMNSTINCCVAAIEAKRG